MQESPFGPLLSASDATVNGLSKKAGLLGALRLVLLIALFIVGANLAATASAGSMIASFILFFLFLFFTVRHVALDQIRQFHEHLQLYYKRAEERLQGNWQHDQSDGSEYIKDWHPYAYDLDVIGPHGLYALLNTVGSETGRQKLASMLFEDEHQADQEHIDVVKKLALQHERRAAWWASLQQETKLWSTKEEQHWSEHYLKWLEAEHKESAPILLLHLIRLCLITLVVIGFFTLGITWLWTGCIIIALIASVLNDRALMMWQDLDADKINRLLRSWQRAIELLVQHEQKDACFLQAQRDQLEQMRQQLNGQLSGWHGLSIRGNPFWRFGLGAVLLSDWHYRHKLIQWQTNNKDTFKKCIEVLGHIDALHALATYAAEQGGDWVETPSDDACLFKAQDLAHPLIQAETRIGNDIELRAGQVLLLTGANASGKSTFLRSIALAVLMARVGLPVCAKQCSMRAQRLATVMRIQDALWQGRSRFQAEVHQLRQVLDRSQSAGDPVMLILDEILAGTNSEERHQGSMAIIKHLSDYQGLILITTHDLSLAAIADEDPQRICLHHFADRAALDQEQSDVLFDYKLRPGVLESTNALQVMRAAGLPV